VTRRLRILLHSPLEALHRIWRMRGCLRLPLARDSLSSFCSLRSSFSFRKSSSPSRPASKQGGGENGVAEGRVWAASPVVVIVKSGELHWWWSTMAV
jgi:hypothetical protein